MGLYDRDYGRDDGSWDTGSGWRDDGNQRGGGGIASWTNNSKLLLVMVVAYVVQVLTLETIEPIPLPPLKPEQYSWFTDFFSLHANWFTQPWRAFGLLTYGFLHDTGNIQHLLFNGLALFFLGRAVESRYGAREYLAFFGTAVVVSGLVWSLSETFLSNGVAASTLIGASGGIAAVVIVFALNYPHQKLLIWGILPMPAWLLAILFLAQDIFGAIHRDGNVAYTAHLGGALFGYLYFRNRWRVSWLPKGLLKMPSLKSGPKLKIHSEESEPAESTDDRLDEILEKIQRSGKESLTREERRYLEKASRRYQKRRQ